MAARKMVRAPNLSAIQPEIGMKTASDRRYEVSASLSAIGSTERSREISGSEVAITLESTFSMKSAVATMRGTRTSRRMREFSHTRQE